MNRTQWDDPDSAVLDADSRYWLSYDGRCGICRRLVDLLRRVDRAGRVLRLDYHTQAAWIRRRAPQLNDELLGASIHLLAPGGRVWSGFEAVRQLCGLVPALWPLVPILYAPGSGRLGPRAYAWVARRRGRLGCGPDDGCSIRPPGQ